MVVLVAPARVVGASCHLGTEQAWQETGNQCEDKRINEKNATPSSPQDHSHIRAQFKVDVREAVATIENWVILRGDQGSTIGGMNRLHKCRVCGSERNKDNGCPNGRVLWECHCKWLIKKWVRVAVYLIGA